MVQTARHSLKHFFGAWEFALALVMAILQPSAATVVLVVAPTLVFAEAGVLALVAIPEVSTSVSAEQEAVVAHPLLSAED